MLVSWSFRNVVVHPLKTSENHAFDSYRGTVRTTPPCCAASCWVSASMPMCVWAPKPRGRHTAGYWPAELTGPSPSGRVWRHTGSYFNLQTLHTERPQYPAIEPATLSLRGHWVDPCAAVSFVTKHFWEFQLSKWNLIVLTSQRFWGFARAAEAKRRWGSRLNCAVCICQRKSSDSLRKHFQAPSQRTFDYTLVVYPFLGFCPSLSCPQHTDLIMEIDVIFVTGTGSLCAAFRSWIMSLFFVSFRSFFFKVFFLNHFFFCLFCSLFYTKS